MAPTRTSPTPVSKPSPPSPRPPHYRQAVRGMGVGVMRGVGVMGGAIYIYIYIYNTLLRLLKGSRPLPPPPVWQPNLHLGFNNPQREQFTLNGAIRTPSDPSMFIILMASTQPHKTLLTLTNPYQKGICCTESSGNI